MRDQIQSVIEGLQSLLSGIDDLEAANEGLANVEAKMKATTEAHEEASAQLTDIKRLVDVARQEAAKKHDEDMYRRSNQLRELTEQIEAKTAEHDELSAKIRIARQDHDQVLASMNALRARLG